MLARSTEHGVPALGLKFDDSADALHFVRGSIFHWQGEYFVVLDEINRRHAVIIHPVTGRREIPFDEFWKAVTNRPAPLPSSSDATPTAVVLVFGKDAARRQKETASSS